MLRWRRFRNLEHCIALLKTGEKEDFVKKKEALI